jgi:transposase
MSHATCGSGVRACAPACALFNLSGIHVLAIESADPGVLALTVETAPEVAGCPECGVVATGHGRRTHLLHDIPSFGIPVRLRWRKRIWRCPEAACPVGTFSEEHELAGPRAKLTRRAAVWAADALELDDTTVSALARRLGVDWHTAWAGIKVEAGRRVADPKRLDGIRTLGVDEHIWKPSRIGTDRAVTSMVDLTRGEDGQLRARLLDVVTGRSGTVYAGWLKKQTGQFRAGIEHAALDPFRGYANAIRDELPDTVPVLDAFHIVRLGTQVIDEVRRRVQQDTLGRRGHKDDPLYKIRGLLRHGAEHLTEKQQTRLTRCLQDGDADDQVTLAWHCYQRLRAIYHAPDPAAGRRLAEEIITSFPSCPIPEVARLGRTLRMWKQQVLAYFETRGVSNGGTEAVNLVIEKTRRLAHGFRNFTNYRLRILLAASGNRPYRRKTPNHA